MRCLVRESSLPFAALALLTSVMAPLPLYSISRRAKETGSLYLPWFDPIPEFGFLKTLKLNNIPVRIDIFDNVAFDNKPNLALTIFICLVMSAFLGLLMHFLVFRPLRNSPILGKVIGSIGVFLYLSSMIVVNFGGQNRETKVSQDSTT